MQYIALFQSFGLTIRGRPIRIPVLVVSAFLIGLCYFPLPLLAAGPKKPFKDVYLTENRICRGCQWEFLNHSQVRLTNRQGHTILVSPQEVIGIDAHPILRKLMLKNLHGIGLPGPLIVPAAFEDANDYVCKYCDALKE